MTNISLTRSELRTILRGLNLERECLRSELLDEGKVKNLLDVPEYDELVTLQDKLLNHLDAMTY
jgi:hypothetical protein